MQSDIDRPFARRRILTGVLSLAAVVACGGGDVMPVEGTTHLEATDVRVVGRSAAVSHVMSSALDERGNVYVLDPDNRQVLKFSPEGELLWRSGKRGGGPGEYELPTRIAVGPRGQVHVFDLVRQGISKLDSTGAYLSYTRFAQPVRNPDQIAVLPDGRIVLSGIAQFDSGAGRAVHVYSAELTHQRSFGEPPPVRDPEHARLWGAGGVTHAPGGTLFYSRRLPYEIGQYRSDGTLVRRLSSPVPVEHTPDDALVSVQDGARTVTSLGADVSRPLPAIAIGAEHFLSGLARREGTAWHLFSLSRGYLGEVALPDDWTGVIGYDEARGYLWGYGERELEPVLFRARARLIER